MTICYRSSKKPISPNIFLSYSMNQQLQLQKWGLITLKALINNLIYPNRNENPQLNVKHLHKVGGKVNFPFHGNGSTKNGRVVRLLPSMLKKPSQTQI